MPRVRVLTVFVLLATLALVLSSCSSTGPTLSFSIDVPYGSTAHATLQASDGHVLKTANVSASGVVAFDAAPNDSLVTVSIQGKGGAGASTSTEVYASLTVPSSLAANHDFYMIPLLSGATVQVSGACPSSATTSTTVQVFAALTSSSPANCTGTAPNLTFTTTVSTSPANLAPDGTLSLALLASTSGTPIATASFVDKAFPNNAIAVTSTDWSSSAPASNTATLQFPTLPANQSATANLDVAAVEQGIAVPVQASASATASSGAASMTVSAPFVPLAASNYDVNESFGNTFNDGSLKWTSTSARQHVVTSLPVNETVDTQTALWPLLQSFSWSSNGSVTVSYGANAGTKAATYRGAIVSVDDTATHTAKTWTFVGVPAPSTAGTLPFPELPASLSAFVPAPVASANGTNSAELYFTDEAPAQSILAAGGIPFPYFIFPTTNVTGTLHTLTATTNAPLNPASVGAVPQVPRIGLR